MNIHITSYHRRPVVQRTMYMARLPDLHPNVSAFLSFLPRFGRVLPQVSCCAADVNGLCKRSLHSNVLSIPCRFAEG